MANMASIMKEAITRKLKASNEILKQKAAQLKNMQYILKLEKMYQKW
jgi:hypothetical protein